MANTHRYDENGVAFSNTRLYKIWGSMKARCTTPSHTSFKNYGARGITVCQEWMDDFGAFREWAMATGYDETAPRGQYTLERKDSNGPYSPENCCWSTIQEQEQNKRTNIYLDDNGEKVCFAEYCKRRGIDSKTARYQLSTEIRESTKARMERRRRAQGMRPREEYNRERAEQEAVKLELFRKTMEEHPGASIRKLAELTGMSKSTVGKLKKKLEMS